MADINGYGLGYSINTFTGKTAQGVGAITAMIGDFTARLDEDFFYDGDDRYRTGGFLATYKINNDLTLALGGSMMTGQDDDEHRLYFGNPNKDKDYTDGRIVGTWDPSYEHMSKLRGGTLYGGIVYKGQSYFFGHNSEKRLHSIQNAIHKSRFIKYTPYFYDWGLSSKSYSYYGSYNTNYLFY